MLRIKDIMTASVCTINATDNVMQAAKLMEVADMGVIPVCNGDNVVGMLTDRDIVLRCTALGKDANHTVVSDIMTNKVISVSSLHSITDAAVVMAREQIRRLPVIDEGKIVGIVSIGDLAKQKNFDIEVSMAIAEISEIPSVHNAKRNKII